MSSTAAPLKTPLVLLNLFLLTFQDLLLRKGSENFAVKTAAPSLPSASRLFAGFTMQQTL